MSFLILYSLSTLQQLRKYAHTTFMTVVLPLPALDQLSNCQNTLELEAQCIG